MWNQLSVILPITIQAGIKTKAVSKFPEDGVGEPQILRLKTNRYLEQCRCTNLRFDKAVRIDCQECSTGLRTCHPQWSARLLCRDRPRNVTMGDSGSSCGCDESSRASVKFRDASLEER